MTRRMLSVMMCGVWAATGCGETDSAPAEEPAGYTIDPPTLADRPVDSLLAGRFVAYGDYGGIAGRAQLIRHYDGTTSVQLYADGLAPGIDYGVHVHALPCDISQGGGHYRIDPTVDGVSAENEIWPTFTTDDAGVGTADLNVGHIARGDAQSVVIHDPLNNSTKMVCADLRPPDYSAWSAAGTFAPFAYASEADGPIAGTARLTVSEAGTGIEVSVTGLRGDQTYGAHLHDLPCHVADGGGHYKIDPTIADTVPENELWPAIAPDAEGAASATLSSPHAVRASAQSIVIHRKAGDDNPKVACATLVRRGYGPLETNGRAIPLAEGLERGYANLTGEARLVRALDGTTEGFIGVQGLRPGQQYPVHLHAYSCAVDAGGGHYKIDPSVPGPVLDNELWLDLTTDANGNAVARGTMPALARPEAMAYVIHDYAEDGARIACIELN